MEKRVAELEKEAKEAKERGRTFHQQISLTFGTMGSIAFAGLVLILQDPKPFLTNQFKFLSPHQNFDVVTLALSMVTILAMFACVATWFPAAGFIEALSPVEPFGYATGLLSIAGFVTISLIIVGDVSSTGSIVLVVAIIVVLVSFAAAVVRTLGWEMVLSMFRIGGKHKP